MTNRTLPGTAAICAVVAALAAGTLLIPGSHAAYAQQTAAPVDTATAVAAAGWSDNVAITLDPAANSFRFQSDGIPSHGFAEQYLIPTNPSNQPFADKPASAFKVVNSADFFTKTPIDATITTRPVYVDTTTDTSLGRIGVAISGAQIFNDYENMERSVVAKDDQVIHDHAAFLDQCNGHTLVDGSNYHYHGIPVCITEELDSGNAHSVMIGVLEDGFPVYGNHGEAGTIVTNADLDQCSGHVGATPEFPDGIYHYHLTDDKAPYSVDCYHGKVEISAARGPNGPDFAAVAAQLGVSRDALMQALGTTMPPDFDAAAKALGISAQALRAAMPPPPH